MTLEDLEEAAFWEQWLCLECELFFDEPEVAECPHCDSRAVTSARSALRLRELLGNLS